MITIFFLRPTHSLITFKWKSKMNSIQFLSTTNKVFCYSEILICATTIGRTKSFKYGLFDDTPSSVVTLDHPGTDQSLSHKLIYYCCLCFQLRFCFSLQRAHILLKISLIQVNAHFSVSSDFQNQKFYGISLNDYSIDLISKGLESLQVEERGIKLFVHLILLKTIQFLVTVPINTAFWGVS